jgi:hypothetical protein
VSEEERTERRLAAGAALGMLLAAVGVLRSAERDPSRLPGDAVAVVDGRPLARADYERRLSALASDRRGPLEESDRRRVLERMIDEELLFGRALELELPRRDPQARKDLVGAVVDLAVANAASVAPSEEELRAFYESEHDFFRSEERFRLRSLWIRIVDPLESSAAETRASLAIDALRAGEEFTAVVARFGDAELAPLPDAPLPLDKVIEYLGPSAARAAAALPPGGISDPVRTGSGLRILQLVERTEAPLARFEELRPRVLEEWRRRQDERALADAVRELRASARIVVAPDADVPP